MTNSLSSEDRTALTAVLNDNEWSEDADVIAPHLKDWRGRLDGRSSLLLTPRDCEAVARIVTVANRHRIPLVPQGGNTGLVAGGIPDQSSTQVVLSLKRMNRVREINPQSNTLIAEAGAVLATVQKAALDVDRLFPLSLASEGSATIGGLVSTNAGGVHVLQYGTMRALVSGLEAVLPDGSIHHGLSALIKDNTGYSISSLLCGAEGTLGVVTAASLKLFPALKHRSVALVAVPSPASAIDLFHAAQAAGGGWLVAFELMNRFGLALSLMHGPDHHDPLSSVHPWYVLMELATSEEEADLRAILETCLSKAIDRGEVHDAVVSSSEAQADKLWQLRHGMSDAQKQAGGSIKHDISLPQDRISDFIDQACARLEALIPGIRPCIFGHLGDGNLHFNLSQPEGADKAAYLARWDEVSRLVHDMVTDMNGSISAEHGIGRLKVTDLLRTKDPATLAAMRKIKQALDPAFILNPGCLFPPGPYT